MLTCYLDDSGKDPQNAVTTVAGYLARETAWKAFEAEVEPIFQRRQVGILHATDLAGTRGDFKGWKIIQKQAFVAEISTVLARHSMLGVSLSCVKEQYDVRAKESDRKRTIRPYTFCFNGILDWLLRDIRTGKAVWEEGLALILESGHENNPEVQQHFEQIQKQHELKDVVRSVSFVSKSNSRAIQLADLLAFYTRREGNALVKSGGEQASREMETMLKIITERGQFRGYVAADFGPNISGSLFLAGDL